MCSKPKAPKKVEEKPVQYLRNPFLDQLQIGGNQGRNSLRIDLGSAQPASTSPKGSTARGPADGLRAAPSRIAAPTFNPGLFIPMRRDRAGVQAF